MSGDSKDDDYGFSEGTLFDMDVEQLEPSEASGGSTDSDFDDEEDGDKTSMFQIDEAELAALKSGGETQDYADDVAGEDESTRALEVDTLSDESLDDMESTRALDVPPDLAEEAPAVEEFAEEDIQEMKTQAFELPQELLEADSEDRTLLFEAPILEKKARMKLVVVSGPEEGSTLEIREDSVILGRSKECDVQLNDPTASRKHFRLEWKGSAYTLIDLGSGNGTTVNEDRVDNWELSQGDEIGLGRSVLRVEMPGAAPSAAVPKASDPAARPAVPGIELSEEATKKGTIAGVVGSVVLIGLLALFFIPSGGEDGDEADKGATPEVAEEVRPSPEERAATAYKQGMEKVTQGAWEDALPLLQAAVNAAGENKEYRDALKRVEEEVGYQDLLSRAVELHGAGSFEEALGVFDKIPEDAGIYAAAQQEEKKTLDAYSGAQMQGAKTAIEERRTDDAKAILDGLLKRLPENGEAKDLRQALDRGLREAKKVLSQGKNPTAVAKVPAQKKPKGSTSSSSQKPKPPADTPPPPTASSSKPKPKEKANSAPKKKIPGVGPAMAKYKQKDFAGAIKVLERELKKTKSASSKAKLSKLLGQIESFESSYSKGKSGSSSTALKSLERAYKTDKALGGYFSGELRPVLAQKHQLVAVKAYTKKSYSKAGSHLRKALSYERDHANSLDLYKKCLFKASEFLTEAKSALAKGNTAVAKIQLKLVTQIAGPSDAIYKEAKGLLKDL